MIDTESIHLRSHITKTLKTISHADPAILTDYILALLKTKDTAEELKEELSVKLEEFLHEDSKPFVQNLFAWLETTSPPNRKYIESDSSSDEVNFRRAKTRNSQHQQSKSPPRNRYRERDQPYSRRGDRRNRHRDDGYSSRERYNSRERYDRRRNYDSREREDYNIVGRGKRPCIDYEERGYCVRGDACRFAHGEDRIVVDEIPEQENDQLQQEESFGEYTNYQLQQNWNYRVRGSFRSRGRGRVPMFRSNYRPNIETEKFADDTLLIENIPQENCNTQSITEYFSQFGTVSKAECNELKRNCTVKFVEAKDAKIAFCDSKSVFDNRFVKLSWAKIDPTIQPAQDQSTETDRLKDVKSSANTMELFKKKQVLIEKLLGEQKLMMTKLDPTNTEMLTKLKAIAREVESNIRDLKDMRDPITFKPLFLPTTRPRQKSAYFMQPGSNKWIKDKPSQNPTGAQVYHLDHRSPKVVITGFTLESKDSLNQYLKSFPGFLDAQLENESMMVIYKCRFEAEQALNYVLSMPTFANVKLTWDNSYSPPKEAIISESKGMEMDDGKLKLDDELDFDMMADIEAQAMDVEITQ